MQKIVYIFIILTVTLLEAQEAIGSLDQLRTFIEKGQREGYFPKTVPIDDPIGRLHKLETVDLLFRKVIRWRPSSRCPTSQDQIILATDKEGHAIICDTGRTAALLGSGDDYVEDATGNDIYYPGGGNDTLSLGSGNDIIILGPHWGEDSVKLRTSRVDTKKIMGYDGSFPYRYGDFVIFTKEIAREDIAWRGNALCHTKTGDCLKLADRRVNVLFASHPGEGNYTIPEEEVVPLTQIRAEGMLKRGNRLYVAKGDEGLWIVDITRTDTPVVLSKTVLPGRALSVTIAKGIAYVAQGDYLMQNKRGWVSVVDVRDAKHPKVLGETVFGGIVRAVAVKKGVLYVPVNRKGRFKSELYLYTVGREKGPVRIKRMPLSLKHVDDIAVLGNRLYLLKRRSNIEVFDILDAKTPQPIMSDPLFGKKGYALHAQNGLLAFVDGQHNIRLYSALPDGTVQQKCLLSAAGGTMMDSSPGENRIFIGNKMLYKAQGVAGVAVYDLKSCKANSKLKADVYEPPATSLVEVGSCLLSFHRLKGGVCYPSGKKRSIEERSKKPAPLNKERLQALLYKAALHNNASEVKRLMGLGASPEKRGHERLTPMQIAARVGSVRALKVMLERGAKPDRRSMMVAALTEQVEAMKLLEKYGGNIRAKDRDGCTTLHYIASDGPLEMVKYLIQKGVPYDAVCRKNEAPIHWANYSSNCPVIRYLESLYPKGKMKIVNAQCEGKEQSDAMRRRMEAKALEAGDYSQLYKKIEAQREKALRQSRPAVSQKPVPRVKIKAKQKGDLLHVKFMFIHPMLSPRQAAKRGLKANCIEHIALRAGSRLLSDITTGCNISKNPLFKFYNIENHDTKAPVTVSARDTSGAFYTRSTQIRQSRMPTTLKPVRHAQEREIDYHRSCQGFFDADNVDAALKALYGNVHYEEGGIEVTVPKVASNPGAIPVAFKSETPLESAAVLVEGSARPGVAVYRFAKGVKADTALKVRVESYSGQKLTLIVVAKGRDGRYYIRRVPFIAAYGEAT